MEYWKSKSEECTERCDFQGLPKSTRTNNGYVNDQAPYSERNTLINGSTFKNLSAITNESYLRLLAFINLAWHKTLHVYGNGTHTITVTTLASYNNERKLVPLILDHSKYSEVDILKEIETEMKSSVTKNLTLEPSELWEDFCDSLILWGDSDLPTKTKVPLTLRMGQNKNALNVMISYNYNLFEATIIDGILRYFSTVVENLVEGCYQNLLLSSIDFLPEEQKKRIGQWNDETTGSFSETKRLHHLVEEAAEATPDKLAVICQKNTLTYRKLNEQANQLAHLLHSKEGVKVEQFIALFLDKTEILLMTILGIWKSGAAYIPIDPTYPDERVKFILEDTGAQIIITNGRHRERLLSIFSEDKFKLKIDNVENLLETAAKEPVENLNLPLRSTQLAYVTYTSGTTGVPKGVYKEHKGVVNSITDLSMRYEMRQRPEVVALFSAYVFEPFVRQTLIALVNSQLLVIADDNDKLDQIKFPEFLNKHRVTYLNGTASVLQEYDLRKCPTLSKLILVGEELTKARYDNLRQMYKGRIICEYGFTESALVSCMNIFDLGDERTNRSIGRPLRNVKAYIVNSNLKPMPIGAIGELYIGGVGISRGYMNRDSLTKERFLSNPFQTEEEKVLGINHLMYKTGDLARWLENGHIEYIGRNDFQIKLRGNRIEPAEIESVVLQYQDIRKCTVAVKDSKLHKESSASSRHLVGYFVAAETIQEEELIAYLEKKLPRYMIPVRMVQVDDIKTNINGKVDLKALPDVEFTREFNTEKIEKPRNVVDSKLIKIWSEALGILSNKIGIKDDFFRLGGHSITCIQLIARIRQTFGCDISIEHIFSLRCIERLSDLISSQTESQTLKKQVSITTSELDENVDILANSLHQGLVYHYLKHGQNDDAYVMQSHYQYFEAIDSSIYKNAWEMARIKYPSLRMNFKVLKEVYQVFKSPTSPLDWTFIDICNTDEKTEEIKNIIKADRSKRYDLERGDLFRIYLIKEADSKYSMVFSYHHIIIDGWSIPILIGFVHEAYKSLLNKMALGTEESTTSNSCHAPSVYPDLAYLLSQKHLGEHRTDHLQYWKSEIEQIDQRANLSGLLKDEIKYKVQINNYDKIEYQKQSTQEMNSDIVKKLQIFGISHGITLHSILQFAWHKVLYAYGGGRNTVVGTTISGRNIPVDGIENSVGLFINTLPLVVDHVKEAEKSIIEAIKEIQMKVNAMNCKSNVELGKLSSGTGELKHSLFDSLFVLEPKMDLNKAFGFTLVKDYEKLDYPLAVVAREINGVLKFTLCYAGELFEEQIITDVLELMEYFLSQVVSSPEKLVRNMTLVLPKQLNLMEKWNDTKKPFPSDETLHEVFEQASKSNPHKVALIYEDKKWRYEQLNKKANQLANYLRSLVTINPDEKIALILEKNDLLILSILGVWKSGAAFVPIDPSYPEERIQFMLEDTESKIAVVNESNRKRLERILPKNCIIVSIEDTVKTTISDFNESNLRRISHSTNLCYVIYTSGTTGKPKGVMTEHRGVVNLHDSLAKIFNLRSDKDEVLLSFSNFVFDHFVEQMTDGVLSGQTLLILNDEMRSDKERLYKYIKDNKVTYLSGTPSVLSLYEYEDLKTITRIDAVGEDFTEALFNKIRSTFPSGIIINGYGPTEVSITSHKRIYKEGENRINKSIGYQIYNSTFYVMNEFEQRVPIGAVGELHLGGVGVGRGYLNRDDLTSKVFVKNPFTTAEDINEGRNLRVYKTGDLARFLANGEVECLGRNDFQVKIRGLRIELSEIEAVLLSYPGITHCVVVAQNHEDSSAKFLVGYYTSNTTQNERVLLAFLQNKLPTFMMPNRLVQMDIIPVTINGKCDTKQLPKVKQFVKERNLDDTENLSEIEMKLRYIWSELLKLPADQIGIDDDFFSLGGDSLSVTSMTFLINKAFGKVVGVPQVFLNKSIKSLGHFINQSGHKSEIPKIESSIAPASLAQERLLFIDEMENRTSAFNVPFVFKLKDTTNESTLMESLKLVALRHQSLRTLLIKYQDFYGQKIVYGKEFDSLWSKCIETKEIPSEDIFIKELSSAENYIFKLDEQLPLMITVLKNEKALESFVSIVFHHTCFDGWSFSIFQRDWLHFYHYLENDEFTKVLNLPEINYHYKDYASLQKSLLSGPKLNNLKTYWLNKLSDAEQLNLQTDFERPPRFSYSGYEITRHLDQNIATALKMLAKSTKTSLFSVLASAFGLTLSVYSGQEEILIGSPISNRIRSEFENVIGFFINILPLKISVNQDLSVVEYIEAVGDEVVTSHVNQDMPLEKLLKDLKIGKDLSRHPLVQVMLNFNPLTGGSIREEKDKITAFDLVEDFDDKETTAKYDLSATISETKHGMNINFTFAKTLFCESTVRGYLDTFLHILSSFSRPDVSEQKIKELDLVGKQSLAPTPLKITIPMNGVHKTDISKGETLPDIFEKIAKDCGTDIALAYKDVHVTYKELNTRSNQVARMLGNISTDCIGNRKLVAVFMDKSDWMITCILGVWKSGLAYVPIDPSFPTERVNFIIKDTGVSVIITNQANVSLLKQMCKENIKVEIIAIDAPETIGCLKSLSEISYKNKLCKNDLCYIIYTSGSTGVPKGVMITHKNVISFRESLLQHHKRKETVLLLSNFVFDFSIEQIMLSIFNWGKLILIDNDFVTDDQFYTYLNDEYLTYLSGTPSVITALELSKLRHVKTVTVAGEKFQESHFIKIRKDFMGRLINAYGVTETTVYNSISIFGRENCYKNSIGKFFKNSTFYLLNKHLRPIPEGAVGELCIAGHCVSQGYLNREELNKNNFLANPFSDECKGDANSIIYRTGDLVRSNASGDLEYLGRNDNQIKIRGFRVELQEIEGAVLKCKEIKQCAVIFENNSLACIYVKDVNIVNTDELYSLLERSLPKHMIPVLVEYHGKSLPVTGNGKLDTKALQIFYRARNTPSENKYTAPRNKLENDLCKIFSTVLGLPKEAIGIDEDFFHIGGDSISSLLLAGKIRNLVGMKCNVKNIFEHRTVRRICDNLGCKEAQRVNGCSTNLISAKVNGNHYDKEIRPSGFVPLLPIQKWFFEKNLQSSGHWNQTFAIQVPQLDVGILTKSLQTLVDYHDAFRLRFKKDAVGYTQYYEDVDSLDVNFHKFDVTELDEDEVSSKLSTLSNFNITKGPLYSVVYLYNNSCQCKVWWTIHHLIVDSVSWRVIKDDLQTLYNGGNLGSKGTSFKEFSLALSNQFLSEKPYWESIVDKVLLYNAKFIKTRNSSNFKFTLDETTSQQLHCGVQRSVTKINIQDFLLTAVGFSIRTLTKSSINYVTIEGHGREQIDPQFDLSNTVGWFTTMYPLEIHTDPSKCIQSSIDKVNEALTSTPNKGIGYGAIYGYTNPPLPCVAFNFLGTFSGSNSVKEWNFCDLSLGLSSSESHRSSSTVIDITGAYDRGCLSFSIDTRLDEDQCQEFIETFQKTLKQMSDNIEAVDESSLPFGDFETYYEFPAHKKTEVTLFILPPGEGGAESYFNNLVPILEQFNLVVFNNFYLERQPMETSFEELASMYIKYVKKVQNQGPYNFLGWSFGGVLALEMSRQMTNSGDCIDNLFLIDSYLNVSKAIKDLNISENIEVIDKINHKYNLTHKDYENLCSKTQNIVLFKATLLNEMYKSKHQHLLYEYFRKTQFNNLDDLIPSKFIEVHEMARHSHHTWSKDTNQIISISNAVADKLLCHKNGHF